TLLTIILSVLISKSVFQRSKKDIFNQINLELKSIERHFKANIDSLKECIKKRQILNMEAKKLLADNVYLQTINLQGIHSFRINEDILIDILQTQLVIRNTDLYVNDFIDKYFTQNHADVISLEMKEDTKNNTNVQSPLRDIEDLLNRYENLSCKLSKLGEIIKNENKFSKMIEGFRKLAGMADKSSENESVWEKVEK
ncbi:MAG TPA: hypothetical protein PKN41_08195, partial [Bacteroidales bacterium]|nr:hypothetical protein [Bacteroidales bacterium]